MRVRSASVIADRSLSSTTTFPVVGGVSPPIMWNSVDFPEPDGPMIERKWPFSTSRSTPRRAGTSTLPTR